MLSLTWVLNSTTVAAIQLFLLDGFVNHSRISQLEHMTDKTSHPLTLDFFDFMYCQKRCNARFDLIVWSNVLKNIVDRKTFFLSKAIARTIALSKTARYYFEDVIDST